MTEAARLRASSRPVSVAMGLIVLSFLLLPILAVTPPVRAQCPAAWVSIPSVPANNSFSRFLVLPGGDVIVGGEFTIAGSSSIARYNPTTNSWSGLGSGINGIVNALALTPDGDVIAGGDFTTAGGVAANRIARYSPTTGVWSTLGTGVNNNTVNAVVVLSSEDVIVGGSFTSAGGVAVNKLARYNPMTNAWSALGSGVIGGSNSFAVINAMAILLGGDVMVAGDFYAAGGVASGGIARYNPTTGVWSTPGFGPGSFIIYTLAVLPGGDVVTGGFQAFAGGGPGVGLIARCNLATNVWTGLGTYTSGLTTGLTVLPGGDLIVTGTWTVAAGMTVNHVVRCNPTTNVWSALGSGLERSPPSASVGGSAVLPDGDLIVGGRFNIAGGVPVNNIARYTFGSPAPSITAQPHSAVVCPSGNAVLSVSASGVGSLTYQWQWQPAGAGTAWVSLAPGDNAEAGGQPVVNATGIDTDTLALRPIIGYINIAPRAFRCTVTNTCGTATSNEGTLTLCPGDFNCDGVVTSQDFFNFITAFFSELPSADLNHDGVVTSQDFFDFIAAFFTGCSS